MRKGHARTPARAAATLDGKAVKSAEQRLLQVVDDTFAEAARRAGEWLACAPGCAECCHRPFPVTRFDTRLLRRGLARLRSTEPVRASAVEQRARTVVEQLAPDYPGDPATGGITQDETLLDAFLVRHESLPCPALDLATQTCDLYDYRPIPCRTFGPPLRFGDEDAPPCRLCFRGAPADVVERCRVEPDPEDLENAILRAAGVPGDESWETLIAFALVGA